MCSRLCWVLDDNEEVFLVGSHHYLVFLGSDTQESEVVLGVNVAHCRPGGTQGYVLERVSKLSGAILCT